MQRNPANRTPLYLDAPACTRKTRFSAGRERSGRHRAQNDGPKEGRVVGANFIAVFAAGNKNAKRGGSEQSGSQSRLKDLQCLRAAETCPSMPSNPVLPSSSTTTCASSLPLSTWGRPWRLAMLRYSCVQQTQPFTLSVCPLNLYLPLCTSLSLSSQHRQQKGSETELTSTRRLARLPFMRSMVTTIRSFIPLFTSAYTSSQRKLTQEPH